MQTFKQIPEIRAALQQARKAGCGAVACVPTMGALHEGHLSLVKLAYGYARTVVVTIFVNPAQFNNQNDLELYPRDLERDLELLATLGVSYVFAPESPNLLYADNFQTWVTNEALSSLWEGASRPGHFRGVSTVVTKLFNIINPEVAVFGEKDFQQFRIVERLVADLNISTNIICAPISREPTGLARSSRNARLTIEGRARAAALSRGLFIARDAFRGGQRDAAFLRSLVLEALGAEPGIVVDYVAVVDDLTLQPVTQISNPARILVAASVEGVRLIDNLGLGLTS